MDTIQIDNGEVKGLSRLEKFRASQVREVIDKVKQKAYCKAHCIRCSYVGYSIEALTRHVLEMHKDLMARWCCRCNTEFDNLTEHAVTNHLDDYACKFCGRRYENRTLLTAHLPHHADEKPYKCSSCDESFIRLTQLQNHSKTHDIEGDKEEQASITKNQLIQHEHTHTGELPYRCEVCTKSFARKRSFTIHMISKHNIGTKKYCCSICNMKFGTPYYLRQHLETHSGEKPHVCTTCGKAFIHSTNLKVHVKTHDYTRPYHCKICDKLFKKSSELKHMRIHSGEKPHVCLVCEKTFAARAHLIQHRLTHTGEKPYACQVCAKSFTAKNTLTSHMTIHNIGTKKYCCDICNMKFFTPYGLRQHLKKHSGEKPHVCTTCGKAFIYSTYLKAHVKTHNDTLQYQCKVCDKSLRKKDSLKRHMWIHLGEKPYKCNQCSFACRQSSKLTKHMSKHMSDKPQGDRPHVCLICNGTFSTDAMLKSHINTHDISFLDI